MGYVCVDGGRGLTVDVIIDFFLYSLIIRFVAESALSRHGFGALSLRRNESSDIDELRRTSLSNVFKVTVKVMETSMGMYAMHACLHTKFECHCS